MGDSFSRMAYLPICRRHYYLRRLGPAIAPFQPLYMFIPTKNHTVDKYTSSIEKQILL